jgi:GST-like protein
MIDLYYWTTPNGHKITIFLEETGLPYTIKPIDIGKGEQFAPEFLKISPNNRIPAIVDHKPADGGGALSVFESGAILEYLADKTGKFLPRDVRGRVEVMQWLFWQMGERYTKETERLYGVLDERLADREFVAGAYSIADMACYPWIVLHERQGQNLDDFSELKRWFETIQQRDAVKRAYEVARTVNPDARGMTEEAKKILFGQGRRPKTSP